MSAITHEFMPDRDPGNRLFALVVAYTFLFLCCALTAHMMPGCR